jgi:hypothetical protein
MPLYELAEAADADLLAVAHYTISTWGAEQACREEALLESHFKVPKSRSSLIVGLVEFVDLFPLAKQIADWFCFELTIAK